MNGSLSITDVMRGKGLRALVGIGVAVCFAAYEEAVLHFDDELFGRYAVIPQAGLPQGRHAHLPHADPGAGMLTITGPLVANAATATNVSSFFFGPGFDVDSLDAQSGGL